MFYKNYKVLANNTFSKRDYQLVPIRYEDRFRIMKWRNEQIYHLRQPKPLTEQDQENYFNNVVSKIFNEDQPKQLLFSFLKGEKCIGYGGLVHINWVDKNAEISFIMKTALENDEFEKIWTVYLQLIEQVAFQELKFHKLYTYAFDLRPHLYSTLENNAYRKEAVLKEHCLFERKYKDVIIHSKINHTIHLRKITAEDKNITFEWANDKVTRENSFNTKLIDFAEHSAWFDRKVDDELAVYYICEVSGKNAGLVRFDLSTAGATIGILIDKDFRGKGLAPILLKACCKEFRKHHSVSIFAYIKKENKASIASFMKANFVFSENVIINEHESFKYEYRK